MKTACSNKDWLLLSRYLSGALSIRQAGALESRLSAESDLTEALLQLKRTRFMLANLPQKKVPRNFTLTPGMVPSRRIAQLFPTFRLAAAICSILFVITIAYTTLAVPLQRNQVMMMASPGESREAAPKTAILSEDTALPTTEGILEPAPVAGAGSPPSTLPTIEINRDEAEVEAFSTSQRSSPPWTQIVWILGGLSFVLGAAAIFFYFQEHA